MGEREERLGWKGGCARLGCPFNTSFFRSFGPFAFVLFLLSLVAQPCAGSSAEILEGSAEPAARTSQELHQRIPRRRIAADQTGRSILILRERHHGTVRPTTLGQWLPREGNWGDFASRGLLLSARSSLLGLGASIMSFTSLRACPRPAALPAAMRSRTFATSLRVKAGEQVLKGYSEAAPGTLNRHSRLITQDKTQGASQVSRNCS